MSEKLRRMRAYHPRRRVKNLDLLKQALHDIKHKINSTVGSLVVLMDEGSTAQITQAQLKARTEFMKHSEEMQQLAKRMGDKYIKAVQDFLSSVDRIVHSSAPWIDLDAAKIRDCHLMSERLERELAA